LALITARNIKIKKRQVACGPTYCGETKCVLGFWGKLKERQVACGPTYCGETKCVLGFWGKLKERDNLEAPCTDGRTRLNTHLTRAGCGSEDLSDPTRTRDKWIQ